MPEGNDDFVAGKFDMFEISIERDFFQGFSMILGFGTIGALGDPALWG